MNRLRRYLSPQIAEIILKCPDETSLWESCRQEVTVVVLDLRGFTRFANNAEPEELMALLRHYHAEMGRIVFKFHGTLERFTGDGMMVFFNDPIPCEQQVKKAVMMALEMRDRGKELRTGWLNKGYDLDLGIGLAAGYATVGNFGFEGRMDYGAVGKVTNLTYRLCEKASGGQILTNRNTLGKIEDFVHAEPVAELQLKGSNTPSAHLISRGLSKSRMGCWSMGVLECWVLSHPATQYSITPPFHPVQRLQSGTIRAWYGMPPHDRSRNTEYGRLQCRLVTRFL